MNVGTKEIFINTILYEYLNKIYYYFKKYKITKCHFSYNGFKLFQFDSKIKNEYNLYYDADTRKNILTISAVKNNLKLYSIIFPKAILTDMRDITCLRFYIKVGNKFKKIFKEYQNDTCIRKIKK